MDYAHKYNTKTYLTFPFQQFQLAILIWNTCVAKFNNVFRLTLNPSKKLLWIFYLLTNQLTDDFVTQ